MDLSALIFVALAAAWAVYLIPKALKQQEVSVGSRSVDAFSDRLRVLARREPVDARTARLVVEPGKPAPLIEAAPVALTPQQLRASRLAAASATKRRRNVLATILLLLVGTLTLAALNVLAPSYVGVPAVLLVAWLVLCRVMVTHERRVLAPSPGVAAPGQVDIDDVHVDRTDDGADDGGPATEEIEAVQAEVVPEPAPGGWDLVPVTLPTYVGKEQAVRRTVRTIDLDSTGVWTSGRTAADSALAREADEAARTAKSTDTAQSADERRASGT